MAAAAKARIKTRQTVQQDAESSTTKSTALAKAPLGFDWHSEQDQIAFGQFLSEHYTATLIHRRQRWRKTFEHKIERGQRPFYRRKLKRFLRKGIPHHLRAKTWPLLCGLGAQTEDDRQQYASTCNTDSAATAQIRLDLHRTFPDHDGFRDNGKILQSLERVLTALSHSCPEVGYCQGLNFIAGFLLLVLSDEVTVWRVLQVLVAEVLPDYFSPKMAGVQQDQSAMPLLLEEHDPELSQHLNDHGVHVGMFVIKWFVPMFVDVLPHETTLRVWDALLLDGDKTMVRVFLAIFISNRQDLLAIKDAGRLLEKVASLPGKMVNCHELLRLAYDLELHRSQIAALRAA